MSLSDLCACIAPATKIQHARVAALVMCLRRAGYTEEPTGRCFIRVLRSITHDVPPIGASRLWWVELFYTVRAELQQTWSMDPPADACPVPCAATHGPPPDGFQGSLAAMLREVMVHGAYLDWLLRTTSARITTALGMQPQLLRYFEIIALLPSALGRTKRPMAPATHSLKRHCTIY